MKTSGIRIDKGTVQLEPELAANARRLADHRLVGEVLSLRDAEVAHAYASAIVKRRVPRIAKHPEEEPELVCEALLVEQLAEAVRTRQARLRSAMATSASRIIAGGPSIEWHSSIMTMPLAEPIASGAYLPRVVVVGDPCPCGVPSKGLSPIGCTICGGTGKVLPAEGRGG